MTLLASFMNLAGPDLIVILLIILVLFGAKKLPELAKGMGQAVREFQKAKDEFSDELHKAGQDKAPVTPALQQPASTVSQGGTATTSAVQPDPNQGIKPGDQAKTV